MRNLSLISLLSNLPVPQAALVVLGSFLLWGSVQTPVQAQVEKPIYRCPSANGITPYTNDKLEAGRQGCTPMVGGNVTIVQSTRVAQPGLGLAPVKIATATQAGSRIDGAEQRTRDSDAKAILESELRKAEAKQADLLKEYNNGEPGKIGGEAQNNQKYIDRVAEMKANIARNDSDIAGIRRELGRSSTKAQ